MNTNTITISQHQSNISACADLNNQGAKLMQIGRYSDACYTLNMGLRMLNITVHGYDNGAACALVQKDITDNDGDLLFFSTTHDEDSAGAGTPTSTRKKMKIPTDDGLFIFKKPIFLREPPRQDDNDNTWSSSSPDLIYLFLTFNLAIAQQSRAIIEEDCESTIARELQSTLKIYKRVCLAMSECRKLSGFELPHAHCLGMINNCGIIWKELKRKGKANVFFQHLLSELMVLIDQGDNHLVEIAEMEGFMSTVSKLILQNSVAQAA